MIIFTDHIEKKRFKFTSGPFITDEISKMELDNTNVQFCLLLFYC